MLYRLFDLLDWLGHEFAVRDHVVDEGVHWGYVQLDYLVQALVDFVVLVAYYAVYGCRN